jgi:hypothetical protein
MLSDALELFNCWVREISLVVSGGQSKREVDELLSCVRSRLREVPVVLLPTAGMSGQTIEDSHLRAVTRPFHGDDLLEALDQLENAPCTVPDVICA